jgi:hypothetical protein
VRARLRRLTAFIRAVGRGLGNRVGVIGHVSAVATAMPARAGELIGCADRLRHRGRSMTITDEE